MPEAAFHVSNAIHAKDQMFSGDLERYLSVGADALAKIRSILSIFSAEPASILDLGCGCGRVARHLRAAFPDAALHVADLMPYAAQFCAAEFGGVIAPVSKNFSKATEQSFDLIWSGSVMTHIPMEAASAMLDFMCNSLAPNGVAIWTVHGRHVAEKFRSGRWPYKLSSTAFAKIVEEFEACQYAYTDYERMTGYGISMTPLSWIADQLGKRRDIRLVALVERGWDEHQDVIAVRKAPI